MTETTNTQQDNDMSLISDVLGAAGQYFDYRAARDFAPPPVPRVIMANNPLIPDFIEGNMPGSGVASCGTGCDAPRYLTYDCKTGEFKKRRRRRRRTGMTKSQMNDVQFVAGLPNNQNVRQYLATMNK